MRVSDELLRVHMRLRHVGRSALSLNGPFRFGVTEAVALTWLSRFSSLIQARFEGLVPISTVDTSVHLNELLLDRKIDLVIATERNLDPGLILTPLTEADRVWVASPNLVSRDRFLSAAELGALPMLGHGDMSLHYSVMGRLLRGHGVTPRIVTSCTSMSALARMAIDGVGITYLHRDVFAADIEAGSLRVIPTEIEIPPIRYVAAHRDDVISPMAALVAAEALAVCSFKRPASST